MLLARGFRGGIGVATVTLGVLGIPAVARGAALAAAAARQSEEQLDDVTLSAIKEIRQVTGLDGDALALANLSTPQLEIAIPSVISWYQSNRAEYEARRGAAGDAWAALRAARLRQGRGESTEEEAQLLAAATSADSNYKLFVEQLRTSVVGTLGESQVAALDLARRHPGLSTAMRGLDLSESQITALQSLSARRQLGPNNADTRSANDAAAAEILGASNVSQMQALAQFVGDASARVAAVVAEYLTPPPETTDTESSEQ